MIYITPYDRKKEKANKQAALTPLQKKLDRYSKQGSILPENVLYLR